MGEHVALLAAEDIEQSEQEKSLGHLLKAVEHLFISWRSFCAVTRAAMIQDRVTPNSNHGEIRRRS
jgi:hypothetical protein